MKTLTRSLALALTLVTLAGCNAGTLTAATGTDSGYMFGPNGDGSAIGGGPGGPGGMGGGLMGLDRYLADLDLTDAQYAQIQAATAHEPPTGQPPTAGTDLQALLVADTLDVAAIRAAVAAQPQGGQPGGDRVTAIKAVYDVLTATQRTALAAAISADPAQPMGAPMGDAPTMTPPSPDASLGLTADQQAAYDAFFTAMSANRAPGGNDPTAQQTAMAAYFQSGDATALEAALGAQVAASAFPVDALVTLATSLSLTQRQALFAQGLPGIGGPGGGMPGGPGFM